MTSAGILNLTPVSRACWSSATSHVAFLLLGSAPKVFMSAAATHLADAEERTRTATPSAAAQARARVN